MDDLTKIKGIGAATAKKLIAAGIDSYAKLAAATPDQLNAAQIAGGQADWAKFIAGAAKLVPPAEQRQLSDQEVMALVQQWDDARAELSGAGEAVALVQAQIETKAEGDDQNELDARLVNAQEREARARDVIAALTPLPEGLRLPDAKTKAEIPTDPQNGSDTAAQGSEEGLDQNAPLEAGAVAGAPDLLDLDTLFLEALERLAVENGQAADAIYDFAERLLSGRDELVNDIEPADLAPGSAEIVGQDLVSVIVVGPPSGRWRAGRHFAQTPTSALVTLEDLELIDGDPKLSWSLQGEDA